MGKDYVHAREIGRDVLQVAHLAIAIREKDVVLGGLRVTFNKVRREQLDIFLQGDLISCRRITAANCQKDVS